MKKSSVKFYFMIKQVTSIHKILPRDHNSTNLKAYSVVYFQLGEIGNMYMYMYYNSTLALALVVNEIFFSTCV